jgi:hypothetical protein
LNLHLKIYGYHPAQVFNTRLMDVLLNKKQVSDYLDKDFE